MAYWHTCRNILHLLPFLSSHVLLASTNPFKSPTAGRPHFGLQGSTSCAAGRPLNVGRRRWKLSGSTHLHPYPTQDFDATNPWKSHIDAVDPPYVVRLGLERWMLNLYTPVSNSASGNMLQESNLLKADKVLLLQSQGCFWVPNSYTTWVCLRQQRLQQILHWINIKLKAQAVNCHLQQLLKQCKWGKMR